MKVFDCECGYRFIVGKKRVYGPIYAIRAPFTGDAACYTRGRMMTRAQFEDDYSDCAAALARA